jgi:hypothetical protein
MNSEEKDLVSATSHRATSTTTLLLTPSAVRLGALIFIARVISLAAKFWEIGTMYNMLIKITTFTTIATAAATTAATTTVVTTTAPAAIRNTTTAARLY